MKTFISQENPFGANRYGFLWEQVRNFGPGKHLDYGAYDGKVLKKLIETGVIKQGYGIDINRTIVEQSQSQMPPDVILQVIQKGEKLPFPDEFFDTISILDVLEHISDQKAVLRELHRVLKSRGALILSVPRKHVFSFLDVGNFKFLFPRLHKFYYQRRYSPAEYEQRYVHNEYGLVGDIEVEKKWHQHFREKELRLLLQDCGFSEFQFDGSALFARPLAIVSMLVPGLSALIKKIMDWDARSFEHMNCFVLAVKKGSQPAGIEAPHET